MNNFIKFYLNSGFNIFPIKYGEKVPATKHGVKDAASTWNATGQTNVAIATGQASGIVVLDIDGEKGQNSLRLLQEEFGDLPTTLSVKTPSGGQHFYFKAPSEPLKNKVGFFPGLDFRANGGYVVAPPSYSKKNEAYYEFTSNNPLLDVPDWLKTCVLEERRVETEYLDADGCVVKGHRNEYLYKVGCRLRRSGLSQQAIESALSVENQEKCLPPIDDHEIKVISKSASKYKPTDPIKITENPTMVHTIHAKDLIPAMCVYLKDKDKVKGQSYFLPELDKLMGGGMRTGEVTGWHAIAKTGKNTVWHKLLYLQCMHGIPNGYASRELTPESEVLPNLYSIHFQENTWLSEQIHPERFTDLTEKWPLYFCRGYGLLRPSQLRAWIKELKTKGVEYFWFDHLHYMLENPEDHQAASALVKEIKQAAKEEDVHISLIIQPNKIFEGQGLSLNSLKGGSAIGQAIDNLITLERVKEVENIMHVRLTDARSKLCKLGEFYLKYDPETTDMKTIEKRNIKWPYNPYMSQYGQNYPGRRPNLCLNATTVRGINEILSKG